MITNSKELMEAIESLPGSNFTSKLRLIGLSNKTIGKVRSGFKKGSAKVPPVEVLAELVAFGLLTLEEFEGLKQLKVLKSKKKQEKRGTRKIPEEFKNIKPEDDIHRYAWVKLREKANEQKMGMLRMVREEADNFSEGAVAAWLKLLKNGNSIPLEHYMYFGHFLDKEIVSALILTRLEEEENTIKGYTSKHLKNNDLGRENLINHAMKYKPDWFTENREKKRSLSRKYYFEKALGIVGEEDGD